MDRLDMDTREETDDRDVIDLDPLTDSQPTLDSALFDPAELAGYRERWQHVQAGFVDDPRAAVRDADTLVDEVLGNLAERLSSHKGRLDGQWNHDGTAETEEMRQAIRRYRGFFHRLLSA